MENSIEQTVQELVDKLVELLDEAKKKFENTDLTDNQWESLHKAAKWLCPVKSLLLAGLNAPPNEHQ